eukprot:1286548-Pleurochrysis_carterae.AAC.1
MAASACALERMRTRAQQGAFDWDAESRAPSRRARTHSTAHVHAPRHPCESACTRMCPCVCTRLLGKNASSVAACQNAAKPHWSGEQVRKVPRSRERVCEEISCRRHRETVQMRALVVLLMGKWKRRKERQ